MPTTRGVESPSECSTAPAKRPWFDSTRPMPASRGQASPHCGLRAASRRAALLYAASAVLGIPLAARPDTGAVRGAGAVELVARAAAAALDVDAGELARVAASWANATAPAGR